MIFSRLGFLGLAMSLSSVASAFDFPTVAQLGVTLDPDLVSTSNARSARHELPPDYVVTPSGAFHPSCVHELPSGASVDDGVVTRLGSVISNITPCLYPSYRPDTIVTPLATVLPPVDYSVPGYRYNGWLTFAWYKTGTQSPFSNLSVNFKVPNYPPLDNNQVVAIFPGFQDTYPSGNWIIQPVIYYNKDWGWVMFSAYYGCGQPGCTNNSFIYTNPVSVFPGHVMRGTVSRSGGVPIYSPTQKWVIKISNLTNGKSSVLNSTTYYGNPTFVTAGAVETYNIANCANFPSPDYEIFSSILVNGVTPPTSKWIFTHSSFSPACGYGGYISGSNIRLNF